MNSRVVELLEMASMWITTRVHEDDIEHERKQMEAKYDRKLEVHEITHPTRSGVQCTRIEWRIV